MKTPYAGYDVLAKWDSPSFNPITREVLTRRMHAVPGVRFFTPDQFALLEAICARLIPQPDRVEPVPIAPFVDADLFEGRTEGFRSPAMAPISDAWRKGRAGIDAEARRRYARPFVALDPASQDATLTAVQHGEVDPAHFDGAPAADFFKDMLLKSVVGVYYSHPAAWSEMGFGGPASPRGFVRMGLDERDPWEAPIAPPAGGPR